MCSLLAAPSTPVKCHYAKEKYPEPCMCGHEPVQYSAVDLLLPPCGTWRKLPLSLNLRSLVWKTGPLVPATENFQWIRMTWGVESAYCSTCGHLAKSAGITVSAKLESWWMLLLWPKPNHSPLPLIPHGTVSSLHRLCAPESPQTSLWACLGGALE